MIDVDFVKFAVSFVGSVILFMIFWALLKRDVTDPTLPWMASGLLSWAIRTFFFIGKPADFSYYWITYLFSPITNIIFSYAAFQFSRVKENKTFQRFKWPTVLFVGFLGLFVLIIPEKPKGDGMPLGVLIDVIASFITLCVLTLGLGYSFRKYRFKIFLVATIVICFGVMVGQVAFSLNGYVTLGKVPTIKFLATQMKSFFDIAFIFLLVSQAAVWGLSSIASLNIVGKPNRVPIIAMQFDIRGSTKWVRGLRSDDYYLIKFLNELRKWFLLKVKDFGDPSMVKFLGDGYLFVWEFKECPKRSDIRSFCQCAFEIVTEYREWKEQKTDEEEMWQGVPNSVGIGLEEGNASRVVLENGMKDYVGDKMNLVTKLQNLARPEGMVITKKTWEALDSSIKELFPEESDFEPIPGEKIPVKGTKDVIFNNPPPTM